MTLLFLFISGENLEYWLESSVDELIGLLFFPFGLISGLMLAWRKELLGGAVATGNVVVFYVIYGWIFNNFFVKSRWYTLRYRALCF